MNHLENEKSPYLQQHAENPVDWYPHSEIAFDKAKHENKLIFLSIGYSACHWCHVMAHESFENEKIAKILNSNFVSIKIDREENPDLDKVYQITAQLMGQSGGWPLSVFLTPDGKPFFTGTNLDKGKEIKKFDKHTTISVDYMAQLLGDELALLIQRPALICNGVIMVAIHDEYGKIDKSLTFMHFSYVYAFCPMHKYYYSLSLFSFMGEIISIAISIILFLTIMILYTQEKLDIVSLSLIAAILACVVVVYTIPNPLNAESGKYELMDFFSFIEWDALLFIISMGIIVQVLEKYKIFQWVAVKILHVTKADHRKFFYLICITASVSSAIVSDITVGMIFIPLVIKATKILKIDSTPYLFGLSFTINLGSIYTPFSSSENVLIASAFNLDFLWFMRNFTLIYFPLLIFTLYLVDRLSLSKIEAPTEYNKTILLEIMKPDLVVPNMKKFKVNSILFGIIIIGFIAIPQTYIVAIIGAITLCLVNGLLFTDNLKKIDWTLIVFFISLFLLLGTMNINGTFDYISVVVGKWLPDNILLTAFVLMVLIAVLSGFLAQVPTALVFITLLSQIYPEGVPNIIIVAFLLSINIGSNFLPQGAACDIISLNLAKENGVKGYNYKSLLKNGSAMTLIHIVNSLIYLTLYALFTGVI